MRKKKNRKRKGQRSGGWKITRGILHKGNKNIVSRRVRESETGGRKPKEGKGGSSNAKSGQEGFYCQGGNSGRKPTEERGKEVYQLKQCEKVFSARPEGLSGEEKRGETSVRRNQ